MKPEKLKNVTMSMRKTADGYRIETSLPWANFPGIKPGRGAVFGFDAILGNADPDANGKPMIRSKIAWEGLQDDFVNASRYGRIMLTESISYSNDFESEISGWLQHRWSGGTNISISLDHTQAHSGKQSLKITKNNSIWGGAFINVSFTNKTKYQFSCMAKLPESATNEPSMNLTVMYLPDGVKVKQFAKPFKPKELKTADGWTRLTCEFTIDEPEGTMIPDGKDNGVYFPTGTTANCALFMDNFELRVIPDAK